MAPPRPRAAAPAAARSPRCRQARATTRLWAGPGRAAMRSRRWATAATRRRCRCRGCAAQSARCWCDTARARGMRATASRAPPTSRCSQSWGSRRRPRRSGWCACRAGEGGGARLRWWWWRRLGLAAGGGGACMRGRVCGRGERGCDPPRARQAPHPRAIPPPIPHPLTHTHAHTHPPPPPQLADWDFQCMFFSPLQRAAQTADIVWGTRAEPTFTLPCLREIDLYSFQVGGGGGRRGAVVRGPSLSQRHASPATGSHAGAGQDREPDAVRRAVSELADRPRRLYDRRPRAGGARPLGSPPRHAAPCF